MQKSALSQAVRGQCPKAQSFFFSAHVARLHTAVPGPTKRRPAVDLSKLRKGGALPSLPVTRLRLCLSLSRPSVRAWLCARELPWHMEAEGHSYIGFKRAGTCSTFDLGILHATKLSPKVGRDQERLILYLQQSLWHPNGAIL